MPNHSKRVSGVLLPIASLRSDYGIGGFGEEAKRFARLLVGAGQSLWQILPLTIPDQVHSPYASPSAFAGSILYIDPEGLAGMGLADEYDLRRIRRESGESIDYAFAARAKEDLLRSAFRRFEPGEDYEKFVKREKYWLSDFALFDALKERFGGRPYWEWDEKLRLREPSAVKRISAELKTEMDFRIFCQYIFDFQLRGLREYLSGLGITLVGDIPFYVANDSADVWAHPGFFNLDKRRMPKSVAGVPPDYFSPTGQLWGNPVYDWDALGKSDYDWWIKRLGRCERLYDITRLDHFRAFDKYYTVRAGAKDASVGRWRRGPGMAFFERVKKKLPGLRLIAEDLGDVGESVDKLRRKAGIPGMRVLQFAFDGSDSSFLPHNYERRTVAYLGTHDNDTTAGWWASLDDDTRRRAADYLGIPADADARLAVGRMTALLSGSAADMVIFTLQDILGQGSGARINTPSKISGCWEYLAPPLGEGDFARLGELTRIFHRNNKENII